MVAGNYQRKRRGFKVKKKIGFVKRARVYGPKSVYVPKSKRLARKMITPKVFPTGPKSLQRTQRTDQKYTADNFVVGYKPKFNIRQAFKMLELYRRGYIIRFQGINQGSSGDEGYYKLWTSSVNGIKHMPLHIVDVTSVINRVNGSVIFATPGYRPELDALNGQVTFVNLPSTDQNGTTVSSGTWIMDSAQAGPVQTENLPGPRSLLDWLQIKLRLWAPLFTDTRFNIQLIQFVDDDCRPERSPTVHNANRTALFQYLLKPYTFNGISVTGSDQQRKYKVLRNMDYYMQMANDDANRQRRDVTLFTRMNRMQRYDWARNDYITNGEQLIADDDFVQNIEDYHVTVNPRARIYLMIRASSTSHGLAWSGDVNPSYDMIIRAKHTFQTY